MGTQSSNSYLHPGRGGGILAPARRRILLWTLPIVLMFVSVLVLGGIAFADQILNGFGIDSDNPNKLALYSEAIDGDGYSADWAQGLDGGDGVFTLTPTGSTPTAALDCYGSDVDFGAINGVAAFICDGHADTAFTGGDAGDLANEEELNIVASGKQTDNLWVIKNPSGTSGLGTGKSDFTHAYAYLGFGDSCADSDGLQNNLFLYMAGHRADNEGDAFWGFEFNQNAPENFGTVLYPSEDSTTDLVFNRVNGDLLVSGEVVKNAGVHEVEFQLMRWDGTTYVPAELTGDLLPDSTCSVEASNELTSNVNHDIIAPPWNIPACDGTLSDPNNHQCRLVSGSSDSTASSDLLAPRDFMEVGIDLEAYGVDQTCFANSFIFTSRSSSSVSSSLKDVGGADFHACDANISIFDAEGASSATNEVNEAHEFTVAVNKVIIGESFPAIGAPVTIDVTPALTENQSLTGTCITDGVTGADGTCTVIINSIVTGQFEINASADVEIVAGEPSIPVTTDGIGASSGPATKTFVDASITVLDSEDGDSTSVNAVNEPHTFIVTVKEDDGINGSVPAASKPVTITVTPTPSELSGSCITDGVTASDGTCTVIINSSTTGSFTIKASTTFSVSGVLLSRTTEGDGNSGIGGSPSATKTYVDASVSISGDATNKVNDPHTFTVTVTEDDGSGSGMQPADGETVNVTFVASNGAASPAADSCVTDVTGQCSVTINSSTAGQIVATASSDVQVGGHFLNRSSAVSTKTYVDAQVSISGDAINGVNDPHTFTVFVEEDDGSGSGMQPAAGETVNFTFVGSNGAASPDAASCVTGADGQCGVTINSSTAGQIVATASSDVQVGTLYLTRTSGESTKTYVDARISFMRPAEAYNRINDQHPFTVLVESDNGSGTFGPVAGATVAVTSSGVGSIIDDTCSGGTDESGQCTVTINSTETGITTVNASVDLVVGGTEGARVSRTTSPDAVKTWMDARMSISPASGTSEVGVAYPFTVTIEVDDGSGVWQPASLSGVGVTATGLTVSSGTCGVSITSGACDFSAVSDLTGTFAISANGTVVLNGVDMPVSATDATLTFVDASVSISGDATNEINDQHTFTVTVMEDDGSGSGPVAAASETVDVTFVGSNGAASPDAASCVTDGSGQCDVTINSSSTGQIVATASSFVEVGGILLSRSSAPSTKTYVDASIDMGSGDPIAEVGDPITIIITTEGDDGDGFEPDPIPSGPVTVTGPEEVTITNNCSEGTTTGTCNVEITSDEPGTYTIEAETVVEVLGEPVTVTTTFEVVFVDASITITGTDIHQVGTEQTFIVHVEHHDGTVNGAAGWADTEGATPEVTLTDASNNPVTPVSSTCGTGTDSNGDCTVTVTSTVAGTTAAHAAVELDVNTEPVHRETSPDAVKTWVTASAFISPTSGIEQVGNPLAYTITVEPNAPAGTTINSVSITPTGLAGLSVVSEDCDEAGLGTATSCTISVTSGTVAAAQLGAAVTIEFADGSSNTQSLSFASSPADAYWVDASAAITPASDTTRVGDPLSFTITATPNAPAGVSVASVSIDPTGTTGLSPVDDCDASGTGTALSCTVTVTSNNSTSANIGADVALVFSDPAGNTVAVNPAVATAEAYWVDSTIEITPSSAVNLVGQEHTFDILITFDENGVPGTNKLDITPSVNPTPDLGFTHTCNQFVLDGTAGTATCSLTLNSSQVGAYTVDAVANVSIRNFSYQLSTSANGAYPSAVKKYVDAQVSIEPASSTSQAGTPQVFNVTVAPLMPAGVTVTDVTVTLDDPSQTNTCNLVDASNLSCTITVTSEVVGTADVGVTAVVDFADNDSASTATATDTASATHSWVNAGITITPASDVHQVGEQHEFVITVTADPSGPAPTFGDIVTSVTGGNLIGNTCDSPTGDAYSQTCTITVNSTAVGTVEASADVSVQIGDVNISLSDSAITKYVDATISIEVDGESSPVGSDYIFDVLVSPNMPAGVSIDSIDVTINGTEAIIKSHTCGPESVNAGNLACQVTVNSDAPAVEIVDAEVNIVFADNSSADTATVNNSDSATHSWVSASMTITPASDVNVVNDDHTFAITISADAGGPPPQFGAINPVVNGASVVYNDCDQPTGNAHSLSCNVTINSRAVGEATITADTLVTINNVPFTLSASATKYYVDASVTIEADGTSTINDTYPFTVTVTIPAETPTGVNVDSVTVTPNGDVGFISGNDCGQLTGEVLTCTIAVNSAIPATATITANLEVVFSDPASGSTATATGSDSATHTWEDPGIAVSVTPTQAVVCEGVGTSVGFDILVTNTGSIDLNSVSLTHGIMGDVSTEMVLGALATNGSYTETIWLDVSSTMDYEATASATFAGTHGSTVISNTNQATVTAAACQISGHKYQVLGDGTLAPLANWEITLSDGSGDPPRTAMTNEFGEYTFVRLEEGTYQIAEVQQSGYEQVFPTNNETHQVTLSLEANYSSENVDFHNRVISNAGRMTGGGSFFGSTGNESTGNRGGRNEGMRVTHGFQLRCDPNAGSNLQVNWDGGNSFHLTSLFWEANGDHGTSRCATEYPEGPEGPAVPTFHGVGEGRCNNLEQLVTVEFTFTDAGRGFEDVADIILACEAWETSIQGEVGAEHHAVNHLDRGNHQAHDWGTTIREEEVVPEPAATNAPQETQDTQESTVGDQTPVQDGTIYTFTYEESNNEGTAGQAVVHSDPNCAPLERGEDNPGDNDNLWEPGETWVYTCSTTSESDTETNDSGEFASAGGDGHADVAGNGYRRARPVSTFSRRITTNPGTGRVSFTYSTTNHGQGNLDSPTPNDGSCSPLVRIEDNPGDNDDIFEPGETWVYTCSSEGTGSAGTASQGGTPAVVDNSNGAGSSTDDGAPETADQPDRPQVSWWSRYLESRRATATSRAPQNDAGNDEGGETSEEDGPGNADSGTDQGADVSGETPATVELPKPEFTSWMWGLEDNPEGDLLPPGLSDIDSGTNENPQATGGKEQSSVSWWQRHLAKKRGR